MNGEILAMRRFLLALPILLLACSDSGTTTGTTSSGTSSSTGSGMGGSGSTVSSSSTGLSSSTSGSSSSSGTGGAPAVAGAPGSETVNGGTVCTSPSYKMIMTIGQPTQNQGVTSSPSYQIHGGLIGATN